MQEGTHTHTHLAGLLHLRLPAIVDRGQSGQIEGTRRSGQQCRHQQNAGKRSHVCSGTFLRHYVLGPTLFHFSTSSSGVATESDCFRFVKPCPEQKLERQRKWIPLSRSNGSPLPSRLFSPASADLAKVLIASSWNFVFFFSLTFQLLT